LTASGFKEKWRERLPFQALSARPVCFDPGNNPLVGYLTLTSHPFVGLVYRENVFPLNSVEVFSTDGS